MKTEGNTLTAERKAKLDSIGFVWEPYDEQWNEMFEKLKAYKREHGDCLVPAAIPKDKHLVYWVADATTKRKATN